MTRRTVALQSESHNELSLHISRQRGSETSTTTLSQTNAQSHRVGDGKQKTGVENRSFRLDTEPYRLSRRRTVFPTENDGNFPVVERQIGPEEEVERQAHIQRVLVKERSKGSNGSELVLKLDEEKDKIVDSDNEEKEHKEKIIGIDKDSEKEKEKGNEKEKDKEKGKEWNEGRGRDKERRSTSSGREENKDKDKQEKLDKDIDKDKREHQENSQEKHNQNDNKQINETEILNHRNNSLSENRTVFNTTVAATATGTATTSASASASSALTTADKCRSELSEKLSDRISLKPSYDSDNSPRSARVDLLFEDSGDADAEMFRLIEFK